MRTLVNVLLFVVMAVASLGGAVSPVRAEAIAPCEAAPVTDPVIDGDAEEDLETFLDRLVNELQADVGQLESETDALQVEVDGFAAALQGQSSASGNSAQAVSAATSGSEQAVIAAADVDNPADKYKKYEEQLGKLKLDLQGLEVAMQAIAQTIDALRQTIALLTDAQARAVALATLAMLEQKHSALSMRIREKKAEIEQLKKDTFGITLVFRNDTNCLITLQAHIIVRGVVRRDKLQPLRPGDTARVTLPRGVFIMIYDGRVPTRILYQSERPLPAGAGGFFHIRPDVVENGVLKKVRLEE